MPRIKKHQTTAPVKNKTGLKRHHKIFIGSFSTIVIIFMIISAILLNGLIVKQTVNHNEITDRLDKFEEETQSKINELSDNIMLTNEELTQLGVQVGSIDDEFDSLKAEVGDDFSGIIEDSIKSVLTVRTNVGQGTGFVIKKEDDESYVVTNAHVLSNGQWVKTIDYLQETEDAEFIGAEISVDIALLKIPVGKNPLKLSESDNVQIGEKVIAIGNPLGLQFSVSQGIVSGIHRIGPNGLEAFIQTDAALNPGNSGGPLINQRGEAIGINNFKIGAGESLGFALESNFIREAVNDIYLKATNETLI